MLWGATGVRALRKYVDEIDPRPRYPDPVNEFQLYLLPNRSFQGPRERARLEVSSQFHQRQISS